MPIEIRAAGARLLIEPAHGGRLHQVFVEVDGREEALLHAPADPAQYRTDPFGGGCFPMAPWPNRIRDGRFTWAAREYQVPVDANGEALHGLVFERPWQVVERVGRVAEMACDFGRDWPWEGRAWQRFELGPNFLAMKMEVRSARETFPAGCGWHPWFRRDVAGSRAVRVTVPARQRYVLERGLPTGEKAALADEFVLAGASLGERRLDDCYTGFERAVATIEWERLSLSLTWDCADPYLQVYTPPQAVCLEPQTCAPDAFNLSAGGSRTDGTAVVAPGRPLAISSRWTWEVR